MKSLININGDLKELEFDPNEYILDVLRRYGYLSVKQGCETENCGVCTILMDGKPVHSCAVFAAKADGKRITTIEGVQEEAKKVADALISEGVEQCGYCSPSFVLTLMGMKNELKDPTDDEIKEYMMGNLCRCSGYVGQLRAIKKYLEVK